MTSLSLTNPACRRASNRRVLSLVGNCSKWTRTSFAPATKRSSDGYFPAPLSAPRALRRQGLRSRSERHSTGPAPQRLRIYGRPEQGPTCHELSAGQACTIHRPRQKNSGACERTAWPHRADGGISAPDLSIECKPPARRKLAPVLAATISPAARLPPRGDAEVRAAGAAPAWVSLTHQSAAGRKRSRHPGWRIPRQTPVLIHGPDAWTGCFT